MTRTYARFFLVAALVSILAAPAFAAGPLATRIAVSPSFDGTGDVMVQFTMTNVSNEAVKVLSWNTPLFGLEGDLFEVVHNGRLVSYEGRIFKRAAPRAQDFITFAPGQSRSAEVDLSSFYVMSSTGEYLVSFRSSDPHHSPAKGMEMIDLGSNQLVLWVEGSDIALDSPINKAKPVKETCTSSQKATIASALAAAQNIAGNAASYLGGAHNSSSPRYTEWFGAYTSSRWNTVDANFADISNALDNENIVFNCKCKQPYYAYVYSNQPYEVFLCKYFWSAPLTGTDSKAGTIVHEVSHFNVVAGTDDVTYGQNSCRALADSNPNDAIQNADSHEYFAENTPFLN